jgi:hypothetical protein
MAVGHGVDFSGQLAGKQGNHGARVEWEGEGAGVGVLGICGQGPGFNDLHACQQGTYQGNAGGATSATTSGACVV